MLMIESVTISLERYEAMKQEIDFNKKQVVELIETLAYERKAFDETFSIEECEENGEVRLTFNIDACKAILERKLSESEYSETHKIVDGFLYKREGYTDVIHYAFTAKPNVEEEREE